MVEKAQKLNWKQNEIMNFSGKGETKITLLQFQEESLCVQSTFGLSLTL